MSIRNPLFLKVEEFTFQGRNTGVYFNLHKHANRIRVTRLAKEIAGWNLTDAALGVRNVARRIADCLGGSRRSACSDSRGGPWRV
jgi:hypothetical protein